MTRSKLFVRTHDPIWHLQLGVFIIMGLQFFTDPALLPYNKYVLILLELVLVFALAVVTPTGYQQVSHRRRIATITLIGVIAFGNILSLLLLVQALLASGQPVDGHQLLFNAITIYVTNIFMFSVFYWEMDGGGPDRRVSLGHAVNEDFLFTQMAHPRFADQRWMPGFFDYLYLSATNVTNFASADTVPLSHRAKLSMMIQSLVSVLLVVLVAARAVSILQ